MCILVAFTALIVVLSIIVYRRKSATVFVKVGSHVRTLTPITTTGGTVSVKGSHRPARCLVESETIEEHTFVEVVRIENDTLVVVPFWDDYLLPSTPVGN